MRPRLLLPLLGLASAACEITETVVPPGETVVVMQSVVSRGRGEQWVLLEYSLAGESPRGPTGSLAPPQSPRFPIAGAFVTVEHLGPGPCVGRVDTLLEAPVVTEGATASGVYRWSVSCAYDANDRLRVRAETPAGEVVTGVTRLPGVSAYALAVGATSARFPLDQLVMNRLTDTLRIGVTPIHARAMQVEVRRAERQDEIAIYAFTDTLGISFPGNLINPFEGDSGESVFRAGRYYLVTVAATDSNYYDYLRSRSDPFTGRGFLNHVEGGVGVVGSVEAQSWLLAVVAPQTDPREGRYEVTGMAQGDPVDLVLDAYVDELAEGGFGDAFSAFVSGTFHLGTVRRSGDGLFGFAGSTELFFTFDVPVAAGIREITLHATDPRFDGTPFQAEFGDGEGGIHFVTMRRLP